VSGYVLSADADFDLDEIWEYIAADHPFYNPPAIVSS
jgi:plasmid stabilization system protein ParE